VEKKTIFLIVPFFDVGGQERFVSQLTFILGETYTIKLILFNDENIGYPYKADLLVLREKSQNRRMDLFLKCIQLRNLYKLYRPVCCISFGTGANIVNLLSKKHDVMCCTSIRGYVSVEEIRKKKIYRWLFRRSDAIIGVSQKMCRDLKAVYAGKTIRCIYNAYNWDIIQPDVSGGSVYKDEKIRLIAVSGIKKAKGYWHLIKALSIILKTEPSVKLVIVGPDVDGTKKKLEGLAVSLGISAQIEFTGYKRYPHVYIKQADFFVLPSVREGFPNVLIEAMACGKTVIANDCLTGPREILVEKPEQWDGNRFTDFGILLPGFHTEENYEPDVIEPEDTLLAEAIIEIAGNPEKKAYYEKAAVGRIKYFSIEACRNRFTSLIEEGSQKGN